MHYKNGTPAQAGDLVLKTETFGTTSKQGTQTVGVRTGANSQSTTCNGFIQPIATRRLSDLGWGPWTAVAPQGSDWSATLSQYEKIESVPVAESVSAPPPAVAEIKEAAAAN
jgi:hypothetical protein